jgi:hypothetical protein
MLEAAAPESSYFAPEDSQATTEQADLPGSSGGDLLHAAAVRLVQSAEAAY